MTDPRMEFWVTEVNVGKLDVNSQMEFLNAVGLEQPEMVFIGCDPEGHYIFQSMRDEDTEQKVFKYPYHDGPYTILGPECFTDGDTIAYQGENYYRGCDRWVADLEDGGQSYCVKPVHHKSDDHEDMNGNIRNDPDE